MNARAIIRHIDQLSRKRTCAFPGTNGLTLLSEIDSDFEGFGISAIDDSTNIVRGRPYGGMAILIRKQYRSLAQFHTYNCSRLLGVQLTCNDVSLLFIMPYICRINVTTIMNYLWNTLGKCQL